MYSSSFQALYKYYSQLNRRDPVLCFNCHTNMDETTPITGVSSGEIATKNWNYTHLAVWVGWRMGQKMQPQTQFSREMILHY